MQNRLPKQMGPCGVYCAACPSYGKTCQGCGSEETSQKRRSKWGCKIRVCCLDTKGLQFCSQCDEFPCKVYRNKLTDSHPGDKRFTYRHELIDSLARLKEVGIDVWLAEQQQKWRCPQCGDTVRFYSYTCIKCGCKEPSK
ncbi:DUF3795 domain-containing protein [Chloroflexota bacterium]